MCTFISYEERRKEWERLKKERDKWLPVFKALQQESDLTSEQTLARAIKYVPDGKDGLIRGYVLPGDKESLLVHVKTRNSRAIKLIKSIER